MPQIAQAGAAPPATDVAIGRVLRPWGREGAVVVEPWTHDPRRFERLADVRVASPGGEHGERLLVLTSVRIDRAGRPIVKFAGIDSISDADRLRGAELRVPDAEAERPTGAAWFVHELVGLEVILPSGRSLGRVVDVLETGAAPVLEVRDGTSETLVPLASEIVASIDLAHGRMHITPPDGLIGLNKTSPSLDVLDAAQALDALESSPDPEAGRGESPAGESARGSLR